MSLVPVAHHVEPGWLNKTSMAASIGISVQAFDKWGVKPVARVGRSVYFTVSNVLQNRLDNEAAKHQPEFDVDEELGSGLDFERYRLTKAQADAQEHKNKINEQEVVPVEFAAYALSKVAAEASGVIDSTPLNLIRKNPELTTQQQENIKRELAKAMNALSKLSQELPNILNDFIRETVS
mgnify:CR=1 FL=1